jgi:hypothetical protein
MVDMESGIYACPQKPLGCLERRRTTLDDWRADAADLARLLDTDVEVFLVQDGTPVAQPGCKASDLAKGKSWTKIHHMRRDGTVRERG